MVEIILPPPTAICWASSVQNTSLRKIQGSSEWFPFQDPELGGRGRQAENRTANTLLGCICAGEGRRGGSTHCSGQERVLGNWSPNQNFTLLIRQVFKCLLIFVCDRNKLLCPDRQAEGRCGKQTSLTFPTQSSLSYAAAVSLQCLGLATPALPWKTCTDPVLLFSFHLESPPSWFFYIKLQDPTPESCASP